MDAAVSPARYWVSDVDENAEDGDFRREDPPEDDDIAMSELADLSWEYVGDPNVGSAASGGSGSNDVERGMVLGLAPPWWSVCDLCP